MGDVAVENPIHVPAPHKKASPSNAIPNIDSLEGIGNNESDEYFTLKKLQRHLEYVISLEHVTLLIQIDISSFKKNTSRMNRGNSRRIPAEKKRNIVAKLHHQKP